MAGSPLAIAMALVFLLGLRNLRRLRLWRFLMRGGGGKDPLRNNFRFFCRQDANEASSR